MADHHDSSTRSWDAAAGDWIAHADASDFQNQFLLPRMLRLAGAVGGLRLLDLGCGEGSYARAFSGLGARVTGVDGSERLIAAARERSAGRPITFSCLNANALDGIDSSSFDLVVASMVMMNVEDYAGTVAEAHRVLVPDGALCMSITHPCFSAPVSDWTGGDAGRPAHFAVDRYFERIVWEDRITPAFRTPTLRRHRPLEDYLNGAIRAGFVLREFDEPQTTDAELERSPRFVHMKRVPYFLFMRWQKAA